MRFIKISDITLFYGGTLLLLGILIFLVYTYRVTNRVWKIQSIDTMKYSRDMAREKLHDAKFNQVIGQQMSDIAKTGANYAAIGTPYDPEFYPILRRWVKAARLNNLHIWFRGNWSGWEQWFGYEKLEQTEHTAKIRKFIIDNQDLFQDGDIFTSCPECENGYKIDLNNPRSIEKYREFLMTENKTARDAFHEIGKKVSTNYYSMNYDIAMKIMDKETTKAFGGIVVIDHYVADPEKLSKDITILAQKSEGKIILGEFGVPIPDINGRMTENEQRLWLEQALSGLSQNTYLAGLNYWVNKGGSTALWKENGSPKPGAQVITKYYLNKR